MTWRSNTRAVMRVERNAARQTVLAIAGEVEGVAKELVPVKTGFLRGSIHVEEMGELKAEVIADADYAEYVELGTTRQSPQPFLLPALLEVARARRLKVKRWF